VEYLSVVLKLLGTADYAYAFPMSTEDSTKQKSAPPLDMEASAWFGNIARKRWSLSLTFSSQPVLRFQPFLTEHSWASDPFVLFQNGLRHEVEDLHTILSSAALHVNALQISECLSIATWLVEFGQMLSLYFVAQDKVIYPYVLRRLPQGDRRLSTQDLKRRTASLVVEVVGIHKMALEVVVACREKHRRWTGSLEEENLLRSLEGLAELVGTFVAALEAVGILYAEGSS